MVLLRQSSPNAIHIGARIFTRHKTERYRFEKRRACMAFPTNFALLVKVLGPQYQQVGNAVPVPLAAPIAHAVKAPLENHGYATRPGGLILAWFQSNLQRVRKLLGLEMLASFPCRRPKVEAGFFCGTGKHLGDLDMRSAQRVPPPRRSYSPPASTFAARRPTPWGIALQQPNRVNRKIRDPHH